MEEFQWLASEIAERGGEAIVWEGAVCPPGRDEDLVRQFTARVDAAYEEILASLEQPGADLATLSRRYQQVKRQDYFYSPLGQRARETLLAAGGRVLA